MSNRRRWQRIVRFRRHGSADVDFDGINDSFGTLPTPRIHACLLGTFAGHCLWRVLVLILVLTFVLILQIVGIQATSLVAVLGAASLAIGLALQEIGRAS